MGRGGNRGRGEKRREEGRQRENRIATGGTERIQNSLNVEWEEESGERGG